MAGLSSVRRTFESAFLGYNFWFYVFPYLDRECVVKSGATRKVAERSVKRSAMPLDASGSLD